MQQTMHDRLRRRSLLGTSAIALVCLLGLAETAIAADECGPITNGEVFCSPAGNDYTSGITYTPADDLSIDVHDNTRIFPSSGNEGIDVILAGGDVSIAMNGEIVTRNEGIRVYDPAGFVTILNQGTVIIGGDYAPGISVLMANGLAIETYGSIAAYGVYSHGIYVKGTEGTVDAILHSAIRTTGQGSHGIYLYATNGDANVSMVGYATIFTRDQSSSGIVINRVSGNFNVIADGEIVTEGEQSKGIEIGYVSGNVNVTTSGAIRTGSDYVGSTMSTHADGISIAETGGDVSVQITDTGSIATYGGLARGITVTETAGDVNVEVDGLVDTQGFFSQGIYAGLTDGNVNVSVGGQISTEGDFASGILIDETTENVHISISGLVATAGESSYGIEITDTQDSVEFTIYDSGSVQTSGDYAHGILVDSANHVLIEVDGTVSTNGKYSNGILVGGNIGSVNVSVGDTGSFSTHGDHAHGIAVNDVSGSTEITVDGAIATQGYRSYGVLLTDVTGDVSIIGTGSIVTQGERAKGIGVFSYGGSVTVATSGTIHTYGTSADGIYVNAAGDVSLSVAGNITTTRSGAEGIFIRNARNVVLYNEADISAVGDDAIEFRSTDTVTVINSGTLSAGHNAIHSIGALNLTNSGSITASNVGVYKFVGSGDTSIVLTETSQIVADNNGIRAIAPGSSSTGDVYVSNSGSIFTQASGIYFSGLRGYAKIVQSATGSILTEGDGAHGIFLKYTQNYAELSVDGSITTKGDYSSAIRVSEADAGVAISVSGDFVTEGLGSDAIYVNDTNGNVDVTMQGSLADTGSITTYGSLAAGVSIEGTTGTTTVLADGDIRTYGYGSHGLSLKDNSGDVNVTLSGNISTGNNYVGSPLVSAYAYGILLKGNDGNAIVTLSDGSTITTQGLLSYGVALRDTDGYAKVIASGDIIIEGVGSSGIAVSQTADDVTVASGGTILTNGQGSEGIFVLEADDVSIAATGDITTKGLSSSGIRLFDAKTATITAAGTITTYESRSYGIDIYSTDGPVAVTVSGDILTYGGYAHGISIESTGSAGVDHNVTIDIEGLVNASGIDADAIQVSGTDGNVQIAIAGSVSGGGGDGAGIVLDNPGVTASAITIDGTGSLGALSDVAIEATETLTIGNEGTITGVIDLGNGDDSFTNSGTWYLRNLADTDGDGVRDTEGVASADFGIGEDQFINTGTLSLGKGTASLWQGEIVGLETFQHGGTIDLEDGIAGDTLSISGTFKSDGGSLHLDAVLDDGSSSPQADTLILENVSLLSASTKIFVANAGGLGVLGDTGILLVDAAADDSGGEAFTLGQAVIGAYDYKLHYDDAADAWYLRNVVTDTGSPGIFAGTEEYPALMTAALMGFGVDWSALHNRLSDDRFQAEGERIEPASWTGASGPHLRPWLQLSGARQEIATATSFDQEVAKLTGGADMPIALNRGRALIGVFAGTGRHAQDFDSSTTEADSDAALAGLYASYRSGGFYGNGIVKYEHHWANLRSEATNDAGANFELDIWGGSFENGYRFQFKPAYAQPRLRLNYAHAASASLEDEAGEQIDLVAADSLTGEVAARLGVALRSSEAYLDGGVRHEFLGETEARVSSLTFTDALPGTSSFVSGGLLLRMLQDKLLLSLEAGYARGEEGEELTANAALRVVY